MSSQSGARPNDPAGLSVINEPATMFELRERLTDAERTIEALLAGPGAVADPAAVNSALLSRTQHELQKSELLYRHERDRARRFLDAAEVILLAADMNGKISLINRYGAELLGWSCEELIGKSWVETCIPARLRDAQRADFTAILAGENSIEENAVLLRSGGERLIKWCNRVLTDEYGNVTGAFTCGTDITDEKRVSESLRVAEERMRFALESGGLGIWDMNYRTGVLQWSTMLEAQYGIAPGEFGGTLDAFIAAVHPDDRAELIASLTDAARSGSEFKVAHRTLRPDGSVRWLEGAGRIHLDAAGTPVRGVGVSHDVTERHTLAAQFQQAQKMEAIGRLASGVAHDFNNLLTVITGFADLLSSDAPKGSQHGKDLGEILKAAQRATGLTGQLLAFSRQQVMTVTDLDINGLIRDMSGMFGRLIGENIEVALNLAPDLCHGLGDRSQMEQVIMNLVVNARDAMPDGGDLTIETGITQLNNSPFHEETIVDGSYLVITVADNGVGMDSETQRLLFEPFFTTKEVGKGTGLGLATTYGIVKQSRGYIWVDSEVGRGSTFKVYLPCAEGGPVCAAENAEKLVQPRTAFETVLIVEDEPAVRQLAKRILAGAGYNVVEASSGTEAEAQFAAHGGMFDLMVTDVVMPGNSGPATVERLRKWAPQLKVLYMSGYTEESAGRSEERGADTAFIQKPFTASDFAEKVRETLDQSPR